MPDLNEDPVIWADVPNRSQPSGMQTHQRDETTGLPGYVQGYRPNG